MMPIKLVVLNEGEPSQGSGDKYKRLEVSPNTYQCGCKWERSPIYGDVLIECVFHRSATESAYIKFERERGRSAR